MASAPSSHERVSGGLASWRAHSKHRINIHFSCFRPTGYYSEPSWLKTQY
jgi:hypothetical protein